MYKLYNSFFVIFGFYVIFVNFVVLYNLYFLTVWSIARLLLLWADARRLTVPCHTQASKNGYVLHQEGDDRTDQEALKDHAVVADRTRLG